MNSEEQGNRTCVIEICIFHEKSVIAVNIGILLGEFYNDEFKKIKEKLFLCHLHKLTGKLVSYNKG